MSDTRERSTYAIDEPDRSLTAEDMTEMASASTVSDARVMVPTSSATTIVTRIFAWSMIAASLVYVLNLYFTYWRNWPGLLPLMAGQSDSPLAWLQVASYALCVVGAAAYVLSSKDKPLRSDSEIVTGFVTFLIRWAFWAVLLVGLADTIISFLRVEGMLRGLFGAQIETDLGRSAWRGPMVHMPLLGVAVLIAAFTRGLGFIWLGLLVAAVELSIVLSRFVFSYEQAFQGDLVRFWYAALFLFASAYTLVEEGHVRVDVFYAGFSTKTRGAVNTIGSILMGILFCWVVLALGTWTKSSVIVGPFMSFEVTQSGFGMYVKYLMASFLGVFAVTMMIQFAGYLMESLADWRGDPGHKDHVEMLS